MSAIYKQFCILEMKKLSALTRCPLYSVRVTVFSMRVYQENGRDLKLLPVLVRYPLQRMSAIDRFHCIIFFSPIRTCTCACHGVRNVCSSENLPEAKKLQDLNFWQISPFPPQVTFLSLLEMSKFYLISWCQNFVERHNFHSFGRTALCGNCAFPQNFHIRKLGKITTFYSVYNSKNIRKPLDFLRFSEGIEI